jgi:hypothetical protein
MSLLGQSLIASEDSVLAQARTLGRDVYDTEEPEGIDVSVDKFGLFTPYHSLAFGGPIRSLREKSFNGASKDPVIITVAIGSYAPDTNLLRAKHAEMLDALAGFYPTNSGEIALEGGFNISFSANNVRPTVYGRVTFGTYMTNIQGV